MKKTYVSSLDRLRELPEVFTTKTAAAMFDWDTKTASHYVSRWKDQGHVSSFGERTGVQFNLLKNPDAPSDRLLDAVKYLFPGAIITGINALHAAGATTQIPSSIEIAVPPRQSFPTLPGIEISSRTQAWFKTVRPYLSFEGTLPRLAPEFALADDHIQGGWQPDPDDIEIDEIDRNLLEDAFIRLGAELPDVWRDAFEEDSRLGW